MSKAVFFKSGCTGFHWGALIRTRANSPWSVVASVGRHLPRAITADAERGSFRRTGQTGRLRDASIEQVTPDIVGDLHSSPNRRRFFLHPEFQKIPESLLKIFWRNFFSFFVSALLQLTCLVRNLHCAAEQCLSVACAGAPRYRRRSDPGRALARPGWLKHLCSILENVFSSDVIIEGG